MPTGLRIPVGVSQSGGAALVDGDENDRKIIRLALGSDDNENAFQQNIGMGDGMIFGLSDATSRAAINRRLIDIFRTFEAQQRYILKPETIQWTQNPDTQEMELSFQYLQIESDQVKDFSLGFSSASAGATAT
jgi:hypothetical protein